jgi:hypothetical protein
LASQGDFHDFWQMQTFDFYHQAMFVTQDVGMIDCASHDGRNGTFEYRFGEANLGGEGLKYLVTS